MVFIIICISNSILGGYLGFHGYNAVFVQKGNQKQKLFLLLLVFISVFLTLFSGFIASLLHILISWGCFIVAYFIGKSRR